MFTVEERIAVVVGRVRGQSYRQVREAFQRKFRKPAPMQQNIQMLVNKFMCTGSLADEQQSGRLPTSQEREWKLSAKPSSVAHVHPLVV